MSLMEKQLDPLFLARSYLRRRKFDSCIEICSKMLEKNPYDQCAWFMKAKALTEQVYVDEVEADADGIAEMLMDDNSIAQVRFFLFYYVLSTIELNSFFNSF